MKTWVRLIPASWSIAIIVCIGVDRTRGAFLRGRGEGYISKCHRRSQQGDPIHGLDPICMPMKMGWNDDSQSRISSRRQIISSLPVLSLPFFAYPAGALFEGNQPRQLELCLVALLRILYWAQTITPSLSNPSSSTSVTESQRQAYLQVRLGAKAILTGKVGAGGTGRTYSLATLQFPGCLQDLETYAVKLQGKNTRVSTLKTDLIESLAALVEFDGLETLLDPSPRSSLTLAQCNNQKIIFLNRMLSERVIPLCRELLQSFDEGAVSRAQSYIVQYYSNEIPKIAMEGS